MGHIDDYETEIIENMEYNDYELLFNWFKAITGLISIVVGWGTGPAGWVAIFLGYAGVLAVFSDLTSTAYATYGRLTMSKDATAALENARTMIFWQGSHFENTTYLSGISGY
jgi:hypothetical protein